MALRSARHMILVTPLIVTETMRVTETGDKQAPTQRIVVILQVYVFGSQKMIEVTNSFRLFWFWGHFYIDDSHYSWDGNIHIVFKFHKLHGYFQNDVFFNEYIWKSNLCFFFIFIVISLGVLRKKINKKSELNMNSTDPTHLSIHKNKWEYVLDKNSTTRNINCSNVYITRNLSFINGYTLNNMHWNRVFFNFQMFLQSELGLKPPTHFRI